MDDNFAREASLVLDLINFFLQYSYVGVFAISIIGAMSIIIPIPYTFVILTLGMKGFDPILLTLAGGLGSGVGELSGYLLGYYGRSLIGEERRRKMDYVVRIFDRYGPVVVFLFALTPLPDDLLFIPLGILRYKFVSVFIPSFLGKISMCFILAYGGRWFYDVLHVVFGVGTWEIELLTSVSIVLALLAVILLMLKVDWEKILDKYVGEGAEEKT